jgi:hypothetical protein
MYTPDKGTTYPRLTAKPEQWITVKSPAPPIPGSFPEPVQPKPKPISRWDKAIDPKVR